MSAQGKLSASLRWPLAWRSTLNRVRLKLASVSAENQEIRIALEAALRNLHASNRQIDQLILQLMEARRGSRRPVSARPATADAPPGSPQ